MNLTEAQKKALLMVNPIILADSVNPDGTRIVSWELTYHRYIHSELMTHRMFSRNAASSRAVPVEKTVAQVRDNPAVPFFWGEKQKGMQADNLLGDEDVQWSEHLWLHARDHAAGCAEELSKKAHKQVANRVIEPWVWMKALVTATDWGHFFGLRAHKDAQPEFQVLAYRMLSKYLFSAPVEKDWGQWHLPYDPQNDAEYLEAHTCLGITERVKSSTARCARVSYHTTDRPPAVKPLDHDYARHDSLQASGHWSPFEHCAQATNPLSLPHDPYKWPWGNFAPGWLQYRKMLPGEHSELSYSDLRAILGGKPDWITL